MHRVVFSFLNLKLGRLFIKCHLHLPLGVWLSAKPVNQITTTLLWFHPDLRDKFERGIFKFYIYTGVGWNGAANGDQRQRAVMFCFVSDYFGTANPN